MKKKVGTRGDSTLFFRGQKKDGTRKYSVEGRVHGPKPKYEVPIARWLQLVKFDLGLSTDAALARKLKITRSYIYQMKTGRSLPTMKVLQRMARLLDPQTPNLLLNSIMHDLPMVSSGMVRFLQKRPALKEFIQHCMQLDLDDEAIEMIFIPEIANLMARRQEVLARWEEKG